MSKIIQIIQDGAFFYFFIASQRCVWVLSAADFMQARVNVLGIRVSLARWIFFCIYCGGLFVSGKCTICGRSQLHTCRTKGERGKKLVF